MTAPLRFALVPVEPIERPSICDKGESKGCCFAEGQAQYCCADIEEKEREAMLAASPGNDLLERIVDAKAAVDGLVWLTRPWQIAVENLLNLLDELGGSNG